MRLVRPCPPTMAVWSSRTNFLPFGPAGPRSVGLAGASLQLTVHSSCRGRLAPAPTRSGRRAALAPTGWNLREWIDGLELLKKSYFGRDRQPPYPLFVVSRGNKGVSGRKGEEEANDEGVGRVVCVRRFLEDAPFAPAAFWRAARNGTRAASPSA
jgi:hypothetical protein